jgi:hypothetical protein
MQGVVQTGARQTYSPSGQDFYGCSTRAVKSNGVSGENVESIEEGKCSPYTPINFIIGSLVVGAGK